MKKAETMIKGYYSDVDKIEELAQKHEISTADVISCMVDMADDTEFEEFLEGEPMYMLCLNWEIGKKAKAIGQKHNLRITDIINLALENFDEGIL